MTIRDYSLTGPQAAGAAQFDDWYACPIPRKRLKALVKRSDWPGLRSTGLWLGLLAATAGLAIFSWGSWYAIPAFLLYGVVYASCAESRWHECAHGTCFRSKWLNEAVYHLASFMALKEPYTWRWSHTRHHTHTIIVGRDPEIAFPRPPDLVGMALNLLHLKSGPKELAKVVRHAAGRMSAAEKDFIPVAERGKVIWTARVWLAIFASVIVWSVLAASWLPFLMIGLPTFYGSWLHHIMASTQHAGLAEDVPDHRLNSRTVRLNPVLRFIYSNMNYHVEHHMFPSVPFHALPRLHEEVKDDLPYIYRGLHDVYREMLPALLKQRKDPGYFIRRDVTSAVEPSFAHRA